MMRAPRLIVPLTRTDKIVDFVGWMVVVGMWLYAAIVYGKLPDIIPIHYNAQGEVDGYGEKIYLLSLPLVSTLLYIGFTILNRYPHLYNYPTKITAENALYHYTIMTKVCRYLKLIILIIFANIMLKTVGIALG